MLDLCTGTGCIALLLHSLLVPHFKRLRILGIDKSPKALELAQTNIEHNRRSGVLDSRASTDIQFHRADVLKEGEVEALLSRYFSVADESDSTTLESRCDLLISNPPYISNSDFRNGTTARSVRLFEPREALVPPTFHSLSSKLDKPEDIFYHRILDLSFQTKAKVTVLECGDIKQAKRVIEMYNTMLSKPTERNAEIWPSSQTDLAAYGFHFRDGSRSVIIQSS